MQLQDGHRTDEHRLRNRALVAAHWNVRCLTPPCTHFNGLSSAVWLQKSNMVPLLGAPINIHSFDKWHGRIIIKQINMIEKSEYAFLRIRSQDTYAGCALIKYSTRMLHAKPIKILKIALFSSPNLPQRLEQQITKQPQTSESYGVCLCERSRKKPLSANRIVNNCH